MEGVEEVVIVGRGICGMATAVALKRYGIEAVVLERAESLRATGAALTLASNAWIALDALGVSQKLHPLYSPLTKYVITNLSNGTVQQISLPQNESSHLKTRSKVRDSPEDWIHFLGPVGPKTVHRKALLEVLAEELPKKNIHFSCKITSISTEVIEGSSIAVLQTEDGTVIKTKVLIGCDGVNSRVARWLGLGEPVNSGRFGLRGLSVFPQGHGLDHHATRVVHTSFNGGFVPISYSEVYIGFWSLEQIQVNDNRTHILCPGAINHTKFVIFLHYSTRLILILCICTIHNDLLKSKR
ncbi:monooxygenase 2-like [Apium graveolens]|uniref:monooxygenase 2-like n=1 Tax=Apium graveolens TaxID=4045 RepID=UPI003D7A09C6